MLIINTMQHLTSKQFDNQLNLVGRNRDHEVTQKKKREHLIQESYFGHCLLIHLSAILLDLRRLLYYLSTCNLKTMNLFELTDSFVTLLTENIMKLKVLLSHKALNCQLSLILFSFWYILILQQIPSQWSSLLLEDTYLSHNFQVYFHIIPLNLFKK